MTDLDKLIAAVEAGDWHEFYKAELQLCSTTDSVDLRNNLYWSLDAFRGSLDAALQLHEALLPEWVGSFDTEGFAKVGKGSRGVKTVMYAERIDGKPARSWLLAILRTLKARGDA